MLFYILYRNYIWTFIILTVIAGVAAFIYFIKRPRIIALEEMKPSKKKDLLIGLRDNAEAFSDLLEPLFVLAAGRSGRKEWVMNSWNDAVNSIEGYEEFKAAFEEKFFELFGDTYVTLIKDKKASKEEKKSYKVKKKALKKIKKANRKANSAEKKKAKENSKIATLDAKLSAVNKDKKKKKINKKIAKAEKKITKIDKKVNKAKTKLYMKYAEKLAKLLFQAGIVRNTETFITADETTAEAYDVIGDTSLEKNFVYDVHLPFWSVIVRRRDGLEELLAKAEKADEPETAVIGEEAGEEKLAPENDTTVNLEANETVEVKDPITVTTEEATPAVPATRKEKKKAKKAAKKAKKKAKKTAKKDKKLNKKITKLEAKLAKAKKDKKKNKIEKKIKGCEKKLSKNKELRKAIKNLPIASTETLLSKGAVK